MIFMSWIQALPRITLYEKGLNIMLTSPTNTESMMLPKEMVIEMLKPINAFLGLSSTFIEMFIYL